MARIRTIKPEFWEDERLGQLTRDARLLYLGLISMADDDGRFRANPVFVKAHVFPYDAKADVAAWMDELVSAGRVVRYCFSGEVFGWLPKFEKHQKIDHRTASRLPNPEDPEAIREAPPNPREDSPKAREAPPNPREDSRNAAGVSNRDLGSRIRDLGSRIRDQGSGTRDLDLDHDHTRVREVVELWNQEASADFGKVKALGPRRPAKIREALKAVPDLDDWRKAIRQLNAWPHAHGKNDTGWVAGFDYLVSNDKHGNLNVLAFSEGAKGGAPKPLSKPGFQPLTEVDPLAHVPAGERWKQDYDVVVENGAKP